MRNRKILEIIGVLLTAAGKFIFMDYLNWRLSFVIAASFFWLFYILYRWHMSPNICRNWGFRTDNFWMVLKKALPFGLIGVISMLIIGTLQETINISWKIIPILILYPIWGTIQQFLLIALLAGNLHDLRTAKLSKTTIIIISACMFAVVHYPLWWLVGATFVLALFYGFIYFKERNVYALGLFHGWLGGLFYYTVMGNDPFLDSIGKLIEGT